MSQANRAIASLRWSYGGILATAGLQIVLGAVMARLVAPSAYGVMAMAMLALRLAQYFSQMGVGSAVVQRRDLADEDIRAAFWLSTGFGVIAWGLVSASGPILATLFREPLLIQVVPAIGLSFVASGMCATSLALLRRQMRFKEIAVIDTLSFLLGYGGLGVVAAAYGGGVWSLVLAAVSQSVLSGVGYAARTRHSVLPLPRRSAYAPILRFGSKVSLVGFLEYLNANIDSIGVGRLLGAEPLGFYNRALTLANLPTYNLQAGLSRVLLPVFAEHQENTARLKDAYLGGLLLMGVVVVPLGWAVGAGAHEVVGVLLGPKWAASIPILGITAIAAPFTALTNIAEVMAEARGALRPKVLIRAVQLPLLALALVLASRWGVLGFACVFVASELCVHLVYGLVVHRALGIRFADSWPAYRAVLKSGLLVTVTVGLVSFGLRRLNVPLIGIAVAEILIAVPAWALCVLRVEGGRVWRTGRSWAGREGRSGGALGRLLGALDRFAAVSGADRGPKEESR